MNKDDSKNESELDYEERLRIENEVEKLKLSAFYDAKFFSKSELAPEVENEWLRYIRAFEEQFENVDQITVADRLDNPKFPSVEELSDDQVRKNLDKVLDLMYEKGICLDALAEVSDAELYRFIFKKEAVAHFFLEYKAYSTSGTTPFKGEGTAKLRVGELGYWNIVSLKMPGFVI